MNNEHIFIVRCGEVALKGMNKPYFERMLVERIKKLLKKFDGVSVKRHEGLIFVRADEKPRQAGDNKGDLEGVRSSVHQPCGGVRKHDGSYRKGCSRVHAGRLSTSAVSRRSRWKRSEPTRTFLLKSPEIGRLIGAEDTDGLQGAESRRTSTRTACFSMWT